MARWPDVPHCYGWLLLDARGAFRMRDDAAQAANTAGDVIRHPALLSFIYRNYVSDERGAWYFQNGPQRVYVELEATPYIARTTATGGFITHDGASLPPVDTALITEEGRLVLQAGAKIALVDDRDLAECLPMLRMDGMPVDDDALLSWLQHTQGELQLDSGGRLIPVRPVHSEDLGTQLGFDAHPSRRAEASRSVQTSLSVSASPASPAS